jgi:hypothetical protein
MGIEFGSHDRHDRMLREWLLLLLRFAVTREPPDQSAALAMADELDSLGTRWRPAAPLFFLTATNQVSMMGKVVLCYESTSRASMTLD